MSPVESNNTSYTMNTKELWEQVLVEIELDVSKATFNTWFKDTYVMREDEGVIYIGVPNEFVKTWLLEKYHRVILKTLRDISDHIRNIEYVVSKEKRGRKDEIQSFVTTKSPGSLPLNDLYINKENNLNPRYTFDSFIVGSFNELAHAAAQAIIKNPGSVYNPLFVYGKTGLGKTHLIQAIGNEVLKLHSSLKVYYLTTEKYAMEYVSSVQENKVNSFKEKYRKYDLLIMDDVQFLSRKEQTQEELFHLFNTLYDNNKQIVFSSDMHPNYLPNIEERLQSRFSAGMIVDIPTPDHESRMAILKAKSVQNNISLSNEVVDCLAGSIDSNIRELEGALNAVVMQTQVKGREISVNEVKSLIRNSIKSKRSVSIKDVVKTITDFYNIEEDMVHKKTRKKEIVRPRQIIMYILREDYSIPYPTIGQKLGGRDHTTVIHSYEKIKKDLKIDSTLMQEINQIRSLL